jgi:hypothetical protein
MDACPLLITSIVAVKPEDQGTFFQDFLGLSGYLCSIGGFYSNTALLRTRNAQNHNEAERLALPAAGRDETTLFCRNQLQATKTARKRADSHSRVHAVLGGSSLVCSITEENHATAKAAFIQKLELQSNIIWKGLFAASHYDWYEKQMALIDQS